MSTYEICNTASGAILGRYQGETPEEALDAMAREAGYRDLADEMNAFPGKSYSDVRATAVIPPKRSLPVSAVVSYRIGDGPAVELPGYDATADELAQSERARAALAEYVKELREDLSAARAGWEAAAAALLDADTQHARALVTGEAGAAKQPRLCAGRVADGWKLVPDEMTDEMYNAAEAARCNYRAEYRAALAAAPSAPAEALTHGRTK